MSELLITVVGFAAMLVLILLRVPIAAAMAIVGVAGSAALAGWPAALATLRQGPFERASSYTLVVVPLFLLMGYLAAEAGLSRNLFRAANVWFGHRRGGLAMATVGACAGFAAICGSSVATGAAMCAVALPEMRRYRYADSLSTGAIAAGGTLGIMIPPSIIFVLYGIMTEQSIGKLLMAGIVPGLVETVLFIIAIAIVTAFNPSLGAPGPRAAWRERLLAVRDVWEVRPADAADPLAAHRARAPEHDEVGKRGARPQAGGARLADGVQHERRDASFPGGAWRCEACVGPRSHYRDVAFLASTWMKFSRS